VECEKKDDEGRCRGVKESRGGENDDQVKIKINMQ